MIKQLPVTANSEESSKGGDWEIPLGNAAKKVESPMGRVIRSKGCVYICVYTCIETQHTMMLRRSSHPWEELFVAKGAFL